LSIGSGRGTETSVDGAAWSPRYDPLTGERRPGGLVQITR
jgi:hypothetical protein